MAENTDLIPTRLNWKYVLRNRGKDTVPLMTLDWETTRRLLAESLGVSEEKLGASESETEQDTDPESFTGVNDSLSEEDDEHEEDDSILITDEEWEQINDSDIYEEDDEEDEEDDEEPVEYRPKHPAAARRDSAGMTPNSTKSFAITLDSESVKRFTIIDKKLSAGEYAADSIMDFNGIGKQSKTSHYRSTSALEWRLTCAAEDSTPVVIENMPFRLSTGAESSNKKIAEAARNSKELTFHLKEETGDRIEYTFSMESEKVKYEPYSTTYANKGYRVEIPTFDEEDYNVEILDLKEFAGHVKTAASLTSRVYFEGTQNGELTMVAYNGSKKDGEVFRLKFDTDEVAIRKKVSSLSVCTDTLNDLIAPTDRKGQLWLGFKSKQLILYHETTNLNTVSLHAVTELK